MSPSESPVSTGDTASVIALLTASACDVGKQRLAVLDDPSGAPASDPGGSQNGSQRRRLGRFTSTASGQDHAQQSLRRLLPSDS